MTFLHNQGRIYHTVNPLRGHTLVIFLILFAVLLAVLSSCKENPVVDDDDDNGGISIMPVTPAIDDVPSWSPDGSTIAFYHHGYVYDTDLEMEVHHPDSMGLWFISPDGSNKRMFLKGGDLPAWNPKGEWLAIRYGQLHKIKANGDSLTKLTFEGRNFFPAWSPDGQWIAYDRSISDSIGESGVWVMKWDGSGQEKIFGGAFPSWHPTGNSILVVIGTSPNSIWKRFVRYYPWESTAPETLLAVVGNNNLYPKYSPDGCKIAFQSESEIWLMDSAGQDLRQLTQQVGRQPSWSPDGKSIVYVGPEKTLWIMDADGQNKKQLTFRPKPY